MYTHKDLLRYTWPLVVVYCEENNENISRWMFAFIIPKKSSKQKTLNRDSRPNPWHRNITDLNYSWWSQKAAAPDWRRLTVSVVRTGGTGKGDRTFIVARLGLAAWASAVLFSPCFFREWTSGGICAFFFFLIFFLCPDFCGALGCGTGTCVNTTRGARCLCSEGFYGEGCQFTGRLKSHNMCVVNLLR